MAHRFPVKEIAHQAGVGTATVDRVLNGRPGVRPQTARRVLNAIRDLEQQEAQLSLSGRKLMLDLLVEAPQPFLDALQSAISRELPLIPSGIFRLRTDLRARFPVESIAAALDRAVRLGSDGVIVMAPDEPEVRAAIHRAAAAEVPVVTLATDMPGTGRVAYVGLDNRRAGATAAWLIRKWCASGPAGRIVVTKRNEAFRGEDERARGFLAAMADHWPQARIEVHAQGRAGAEFADQVVASDKGPVAAHYSIGGSNPALLAAYARAGIVPDVFVAHDLNPENEALLAAARIDAVLYHDLGEDIRNACQAVLSARTRGRVPAPAPGASLRLMVPPMLTGLG